MFWGVFTADHLGPCHIWETETKEDTALYKSYIDDWNSKNKARLHLEWELEKGLSRLGLKNKPGKKPAWRFDKAHGKMVREGRAGGIDWIRYRHEVLIPHYWPFLDSLPGKKED